MTTETERMLIKDSQCGEEAKPSIAENLLEESDSLLDIALNVSSKVRTVVDEWVGKCPTTPEAIEKNPTYSSGTIKIIQRQTAIIRRCLADIQNNISRM